MKQTIHNILALTAMLLLPFTAVNANTVESAEMFAEMEQSNVSISINGSTLQVKNADKQTLTIYNLTGEIVYTERIDSPSKNIELDQLARGCYIVKIGKFVRKIYIH